MLFSLKSDVILADIQQFAPAILPIFTYVVLYAKNNDLPCEITSLISDRKDVVAVSTTHKDGRAFDLSISGWSMFHIKRLVHNVNINFATIAAISFETGNPTAAIDKNHGTGPHIHFQVRADAPIHQFLPLT